MNRLLLILIGGAFCAVVSGCGDSSDDDNEEVGQQVGDVMASVDESGGSGGTLAYLETARKTYARLAPSEIRPSWVTEWVAPSAYATACALSSTFGSCSSNTLTRTFGGCTIGSATLDGTVQLAWGGSSSSCQMQASGDYVTRSPSFTVTGRRGATLTVSKSGSEGQRITWASGTGTSKVFTFANDGIRRVFTNSGGATLFDFTTQTTSAITITGTSRSSRTMSGGSLRVTNNVSGTTCDYVPTAVAWTSTCNCASSGSWAGTCSDGKSTTLTLTGCGTATLAIGDSSESITFDRCYGI